MHDNYHNNIIKLISVEMKYYTTITYKYVMHNNFHNNITKFISIEMKYYIVMCFIKDNYMHL